MKKLAEFNFLMSGILTLITLSIIMHGLIGAFVPMEFSFYCSVTSAIKQSSCPPRTAPLERAKFISDVFTSLSQSRSRLSLSFSFLSLLEGLLLTGLLLNMVSAPSFVFHYVAQPTAPARALRQKLRHWLRMFAQSPACSGA